MLKLHHRTFFDCTKSVRDLGNLEANISKIVHNRPTLQLLSNTYLFADLTPDQIMTISALLDSEKSYPIGTTIIEQGSETRSLFIIKQGSVQLTQRQPNGKEREIKRLSEGECFGEMSLLTGLPRSATVISVTECILLEFGSEAFEVMLDKYPHLKLKLSILMENRLRETIPNKPTGRHPSTFSPNSKEQAAEEEEDQPASPREIGRYTLGTGEQYEGELANGLPDGKGKLTLHSGDTYEGDFLKGKRHGFGKYIYKSGQEFYEGQFKGNG